MDSKRFDEITKGLATSTDRRSVLRRLAGGALGGLLAARGLSASAQPGCRREGHPCEGNQECCPGLVCRVTGPGNATRCAAPLPEPCNGKNGCPCDDKCTGCKSGCCKDGYCTECPPVCKTKDEHCDPKNPCCKGYYCSTGGYCKKQKCKSAGTPCNTGSECCSKKKCGKVCC